MKVERVWTVILAAAVVIAVSTFWTHGSASQLGPSVGQSMPRTATVIDNGARTLPADRDESAQPRVDLNGNEIDDAVNDYRVDGTGQMYERHAPDTALLHLGAPEL